MLLRVERRKAAEAMRRLRALGLLDRSRRVRRGAVCVEIPLRGRPPGGMGELLEGEVEAKYRQVPPYERVKAAARLPEELERLLPDRWERLGRVLVLKLPGKLQEHKIEVASAYAGALGVETVLQDISGSRGVLREPTMEVLLGHRTETVHTENYVRYCLDAARMMFSSGNMSERIRMGKTVRPGETVVDMFAGIGYFSLQMAVHGRPGAVHACELNPASHHYLVKNIRLNRVERVVRPLEGDCRQVAPEGVADRIVLGHFDSVDFIPKALRVLKPEGGVLHLHCLCRQDRLPEDAWGRALRKIEGAGMRAGLLHCERVKSFKPKTWHIVLDIGVG